MSHPRGANPLILGLVIGLAFGCANLLFTWLDPLADDTPAALLRFYGPMFFLWALAAFAAARRTGRLRSGLATGLLVAFGTFVVFDLLILVRVNVFLDQLTTRADWQNMMMRFRESDADSLRSFINVEYAKATPLKLVVSCAIGAVFGFLGGVVGLLMHGRVYRPSM